MFDKTQLMRGSLEGCILKVIERNTTYGYDLMEQLRTIGFDDISEGTIYPILLRLEKNGALTSELRESPFGPKRKYYTITEYGRAYLSSFYSCWKEVAQSVQMIFERRHKDE